MPSITATTTERCPCCSIANTLQCRVRSGTAEICGHSEFANATGGVSTPPKKYRTKTRVGDITQCVYSETSSCVTPANSARYISSGSCVYNSGTCATTNTLSQETYSDASTCSPTTLTATDALACNLDDTASPASLCYRDITVSKTEVALTSNGDCCTLGGFGFTETGGRTTTLTDEDTEADAITRFQAANSFGSWIASGGVGCTGTPASCCLAHYESRTSGFTFAYADAEARVVATGLTPSTNYTAKIELYRRTYGSGSYTHYQTATVTGTSDGSGALTTSAVTVTNTKGYETYAASASLFVT